MIVILVAAVIGGYVVYRELKETKDDVEEKAAPVIDKAKPMVDKVKKKAGPVVDKAKRAGKKALEEIQKDAPDAAVR
jgi:hypothetical protein